MAEPIDETMVIAWVDGELDPERAENVRQAVAADPALHELAEAHRAMRGRFAAAFNGIADEPVALPSAEIVSFAEMRAQRMRRLWVPGAIAASLAVGLFIGQIGRPAGVADRPDALALAPDLAHRLDTQLSGAPGPVRVALSFRARDGAYCRSFTATHLDGVACRTAGGWTLRYAAPGTSSQGDYTQAGGDPARASAIAAMIAGEPLDAAAERAARDRGWRPTSNRP